MSRYPMPFVTEVRGCFCCEPTVPSSIYSQGMLNQQFEGQSSVAPLTASHSPSQPAVAQAECVPANVEEIWPMLHNIHLGGSYPSQLPWQSSTLATPVQVVDGPEVLQIQDPNSILIPSSSSSASQDFTDERNLLNFRMLQNRQIVGRTSGNMYGDVKALLSSSAPASSVETDLNICPVTGDTPYAQASNVKPADSMDLDSALDELGMLSTITNSRRQYLIETRGHASVQKREKRLRSKSESSPNLTALGRPNGLRIIQQDMKYVTSLTDVLSSSNQLPSAASEESPLKSQMSRLEYRNPDLLEDAARRRRSVPRMSRMRKDRYRRSRCPYKIPNRLCHSMQESDFEPGYFETCASPFTPSSSSETGVDSLSDRLTVAQRFSESKSNTASPVKPHTEGRLIRSLSAEDLTPIRRLLEIELNEQKREGSKAEQSLDLMTSQLTNLHMS